jgi:hypothetical protein
MIVDKYSCKTESDRILTEIFKNDAKDLIISRDFELERARIDSNISERVGGEREAIQPKN